MHSSKSKLILAFTLSIALSFLMSCAPRFHPVLLNQDSPDAVQYPKLFEGYHAYYVYDDFVTEITGDPQNGYSNYYHISKQIYIKDEEGLKYAEFDIPYQQGSYPSLSLSVTYPDGKVIHYSKTKIISSWKKEHKLIVPQVEPNCTITFAMQISENFSGFQDYFFSRNIPVLKGRYSLVHANDLVFDLKTYGDNIIAGKIEGTGFNQAGFTRESWMVEHLLPPEKNSFSGYPHENQPHLSIAFRKLSIFSNKTYNIFWSDFAKDFEKRFFKSLSYNEKTAIKKYTSKYQSVTDKYAQADSVLRDIQDDFKIDNTTYHYLPPSKIISQKKGNFWNINLLLHQCYKALGIPSRIIATRPHHLGGLDPDFPTYKSLIFPMVVLKIDTSFYTAFPYAKDYPLGFLPESYFQLKAYSFDNYFREEDRDTPVSFWPESSENTKHFDKQIITIPTPLQPNFESVHFFISDTALSKIRMECKFVGINALRYRESLKKWDPKLQKEWVQKILSKLNSDNELLNYTIDGVENREPELHLSAQFQNKTYFFKNQNENTFNVSTFFSQPLEQIPPERSTPLYLTSPHIFKNELVFSHQNTIKDKKIICGNISNLLFESKCEAISHQDNFRLTQEFIYNPKNLEKLDPDPQYRDDIQTLQRIRESYFIW